jgi:hypothetical protein
MIGNIVDRFIELIKDEIDFDSNYDFLAYLIFLLTFIFWLCAVIGIL